MDCQPPLLPLLALIYWLLPDQPPQMVCFASMRLDPTVFLALASIDYDAFLACYSLDVRWEPSAPLFA
jgi:hypothetical protein